MSIIDRQFRSDGYLSIDDYLSGNEVAELRKRLSTTDRVIPGDRRMLDHDWCRSLAGVILNRIKERSLVAGNCVAVLCTYFDKSPESNWGVAPHRDIVIPQKVEFSACGWKNWSLKQEIPHAQPPKSLLHSMFSIRINIDAASAANGALLVAAGSHKTDKITTPDIICAGRSGSALLMSPLLVHASGKSTSKHRRRVLHFLFGPVEIEPPARWYYSA